MFTAVGWSVEVRGFRLALRVEGLRPHTVDNYIRDVERLAAHCQCSPTEVTSTQVRAFILDLRSLCAPKSH